MNESLQSDFEIIQQWFKANNLKLNSDKSKLVLFSSKRSNIKHEKIILTDNDIEIQMVDTVKYLGMHLDRFLTFETHVDKVTKKANQCTKMTWKMRSFIDENLAKYLYKSLIHPIFGYCDFIYDGCNKGLAKKLQIPQNNALRVVKKCK